ncbi:MAG: AAA family ATPase [Promethearchaeati archaeon SRVP18_Atabeyarchaeia-1]
MSERMFQQAKQIAEEAVRLDNGGNYKAALPLYLQAAEILAKMVRFTDNSTLRVKYSDAAKTYIERAQALKTLAARAAPLGKAGKLSAGGEQDTEEEARKQDILDTILTEKPNVKWEDVADLKDAKQALREAVIIPTLRPDLFQSKTRRAWRGIMLFGPPGCGKTMIAKAVATECEATFLSIDAASIMSKWLGESERLVKELFNVARDNQPAIVFTDEVDSIASTRTGEEIGGERRVKTQFLKEMDGVSTKADEKILVLGATNRPWDIDEAFRRRFEKRIYLPMPNVDARKELFKIYVKEIEIDPDFNADKLVGATDGYTGSDIAMICREASMQPIRELDTSGKITDPAVKVRPVNMEDFLAAIRRVRPVVSASELNRFKQWNDEFGAY